MDLKNSYVFPAIFDYADDGISVEFPDLPGCLTFGNTDEEALEMAKEAMGLHLYSMEKDGDLIPNPTGFRDIRVESNQVVVLVEVWMPLLRDQVDNQAIKKTLTIPQWLDEAAKEKKVNFSRVLQDALKDLLGIKNK
ncbi:type II toxin-antitoxin system HicB family antitoxin [Cytobacillus sp. Sa5YUA1]|uniref:Type II toxin-antitoxin system HicB family antitoxin n=1 Tax=Cytobacillus stercorigallinarum TaxID=2762240 RepID=A0ABR8QNN9_9BACI|nr:type II toxin-antitoxin system HicB family antitoxin [Cytobacillus stercorigallinarum]MBD7937149.1 type II toxin-antitoxin system HicB family antitoxin [Cytobacillus stercorigallinarum]